MKTMRRILLTCLTLSLFLFTASAQWVQTNGPYAGHIQCVAQNGTNVFAGTSEAGVFLSTNNGTSWNSVNTGLTSLSVISLTVSGTDLFAGTAGGGIFFSTDNGGNWTPLNNGLTNMSVEAILVNDANLFAATYGGVFLSTDGGGNWTAVNNGLTNTSILSLATIGQNLFAATGGAGVFRSTDNGSNWTPANTGIAASFVFDLAVMDTNLIAGIFGSGGVWLSTDYGSSWSAISSNMSNTYVFDIAVSGTNLFAGTTNDGGVFLSTNNGGSWSAVNTGLTNRYVSSLSVNGANLFAGTDGGGVFYSTNNGTDWTTVNTGMRNASVYSMTVSGSNLFAGTGRAGVFVTTDNGTNWSSVSEGLATGYIQAVAVNGTYLFAGPYGYGVYRSTNNGTSWTEVNTGLTSNYIQAFAVSGANIFTGTSDDGVFLSTDNGSNWTAVNTDLTNLSVICLTVDGADLFVGTSGGGVFLSTDNGSSWASASVGLTDLTVASMAVNGADLLAGTSSGVFLSTDNGTSWSDLVASPNTFISALCVSDGNIFAGTSGGVFLSTDNGAAWAKISEGVSALSAQGLTVVGNRLFAGTNYHSVWSLNIQSLNPSLLGEHEPDANTALLFHINETSGSTVADVASYINNGTATGTTIVDGRFGKARDFNGTSDYISVSNSASLNPTSALTVEAWFKTPTSATQAIVSKYNYYSGVASEMGFVITKNNMGRLKFIVGSGTNELSINGTKNVYDDKWHHVAGVYDGSNLRLYLDGKLDSMKAAPGALNQTTLDMLIGAVRYYGIIQYEWFAGLIDEVRISDVARQPSEFNLQLPPVNLTATPLGNTSIDVSWQNGGGTVPLMQYRIYRDIDSTGATLRDSTTSTSYTNSGLTPGTLYYFRVSAVDSTGFEGSRSYAVGCVAGDVTAPASPQSLVVTDSSSTTLTIKWRKNTESDFLRYRIYRGTSPNPTTKVDSTTAGAADTIKTFTGLTNGTGYYLRVTAVDSAGNESVYSNEVNAVPADRLAPSVPQNLVVTDSSSTTITIKWRKNTDSDFLRYRVYQGTSPNPTTKVHSTTAWAAAETSKTFTGLTNGTRYYLRVTAVDSSANESPYSNEVDAMPADRLAPAAPMNLVVTDSSSTTIIIKWRKNTDSDFLRYRIYGGESPNPTLKIDSTTAGVTDTSKTFAGLVNGTRYYFRVTAVDSAENESAYSNEVNAAPNVPSGVEDLLSQIPEDFSLVQNYPNPFNPSTVIRYGLPVRSHVLLEVYTMLGQRVASLVNEEQEARYHERTWIGDGASGLYFYRLEAIAIGDPNRRFVEVRKMLLLK